MEADEVGRLGGIAWVPGGKIDLRTDGAELEHSVEWREDGGVYSRRDRLTNRSEAPIRVRRALSRFVMPSGDYEAYAQSSRWTHENQGRWLPLTVGDLVLRHVAGRTTDGCTPFVCVREIGGLRGVAFHLLPVGNWTIRLRPLLTHLGSRPEMEICLGLSDDALDLELAPGASLDLPEILAIPFEGEPEASAPALHRFVQRRSPAKALPVVANTWFYHFDRFELPGLREQVAAAVEVGAEIFVIDAGWYGLTPEWYEQAGEWVEQTDRAFFGRMAEFADEVRATGLGFGLWMEPERFTRAASIRRAHPEWFPQGDVPYARIDLENPDAWAYLRGEIGRLIETYRLAWMKIDFNFSLGEDATGQELSGYAREWYRMLADLRSSYPEVTFEGCSSGGMRGDLVASTAFDMHFLSDNVNPTDMLSLYQGALLRLPPGRIGTWAVVREREGVVEAASGAGWYRPEPSSLGFVCLSSMLGCLGLSGDLGSLSADHRAELARLIALFKSIRDLVARSEGFLLTPPRAIEDRVGWRVIELHDRQSNESLVFAFRLVDGRSKLLVRPQGVDLDGGSATRLWPPEGDAVVVGPFLETSVDREIDAGLWRIRPR